MKSIAAIQSTDHDKILKLCIFHRTHIACPNKVEETRVETITANQWFQI